MSKKVAVIMGSDSDFPVVKSALTELQRQERTDSALSSAPQAWPLTLQVLLQVTQLSPLSESP